MDNTIAQLIEGGLTNETRNIAINDLEVSKYNIYTASDDNIIEIATSIMLSGFNTTLTCIWNNKTGKAEILSGQHRYLAAKYLIENEGMTFDTLPCVIVGDENLPELIQKHIVFSHNHETRSDKELNSYEHLYIKNLYELLGNMYDAEAKITQTDFANKVKDLVKRNPRTINFHQKIIENVIPELEQKYIDGKITGKLMRDVTELSPKFQTGINKIMTSNPDVDLKKLVTAAKDYDDAADKRIKVEAKASDEYVASGRKYKPASEVIGEERTDEIETEEFASFMDFISASMDNPILQNNSEEAYKTVEAINAHMRAETQGTSSQKTEESNASSIDIDINEEKLIASDPVVKLKPDKTTAKVIFSDGDAKSLEKLLLKFQQSLALTHSLTPTQENLIKLCHNIKPLSSSDDDIYDGLDDEPY